MRLLSLLFSAITLLTVHAQKTSTVRGEYVYYAPENVTLEVARQTALERAKLEAISKAFGAIVSRSNTTQISNNKTKSNIEFHSFGGSEVRGEWIETIGRPEYHISYEKETLVVRAVVKGKIREIVSSDIDVKTYVLRNGIEDKFEDSFFYSGDDLFVSFQSPIKGYLAIYLVDSGNRVQCLLPYHSQQEGIYTILPNKRYVLFNTKEADPSERMIVEEYTMNCSSTTEQNLLYTIFSPNIFFKAVDYSYEKNLPRELGFQDFQKWLSKCRSRDLKMYVNVTPITIKQKQ